MHHQQRIDYWHDCSWIDYKGSGVERKTHERDFEIGLDQWLLHSNSQVDLSLQEIEMPGWIDYTLPLPGRYRRNSGERLASLLLEFGLNLMAAKRMRTGGVAELLEMMGVEVGSAGEGARAFSRGSWRAHLDC